MAGPIRLGFVGGGPRSNSIFSTLVMNKAFEDMVEPVAMLDTSEGVAKDWRYKVETTCTSLDAFLKLDLDAALVLSPPATHPVIARRCLEAGIDTWSEVPMALAMDDVLALRDADHANKGTRGRYALGENASWYPGIQLGVLLASQGRMGDMFYMEGEYHHSVEHYMIEENFSRGMAVDPELHPAVTPTWRATLAPILYGHAVGPALAVLWAQDPGDRPVEVHGYGNMKMQRRFNTDNFQIAMLKTAKDVICKFGSGFVLPDQEIRHHLFWSSRAHLEIAEGSRDDCFLHLVPEDQAAFPHRHHVQARHLTRDDMIAMGARHATGGHGGGDFLMMEDWIGSLRGAGTYPLGIVKACEMTAPAILALDSIASGKVVEIPRFDK